MNLSKARFTPDACLISIDGTPMNIASKSSLIEQGVCWVSAMKPEDEPEADALRISPCGQDGNVFACAEPQLVELAQRYHFWLNSDAHPSGIEVEALTPVAAAAAMQRHLIILNS